MEDRNNDKAKVEIAMQSCFNKKDKKLKGNWSVKSKGNFQNFGGRKSQNSIGSTCKKGESSWNKNGSQGNCGGEKKIFGKSKSNCFNCQRFGHFARYCNLNKK